MSCCFVIQRFLRLHLGALPWFEKVSTTSVWVSNGNEVVACIVNLTTWATSLLTQVTPSATHHPVCPIFFIVNTIGKFKMFFATVKQEYFQMRRMQDVSAHLPSWNKLGSLSAVSQHCIYPMGIVSPRFSQRRCFATKSKQRPEQLLASHRYSPTQLLICFHSLPRHFSDLGHIY